VSGRIRRLHDVELEPQVRDWLASLSDTDYKRVDEVCGMLAEKAPNSAGRGPITWTDRLGTADPAA
jgi:hypothetical protein